MASTAVPVIRQGWTVEELCLGETGWTVIQVARGVVFDGTRLVLSELAPTMPYVVLSPTVVLGHLSTGAFLDLWGAGGRRGAVRVERPGVLSLADPERAMFGDAVVLLARPGIHEAGLTYEARLVEGAVPLSSGSCVLYVNAGVAAGPGAGPGRRA